MSVFLKPAISLSNALRFKAKFLLLACIFFLPIIVGSAWIVQKQNALIAQYQQELLGLHQIQQTVALEKSIAKTRIDKSTLSSVKNKISVLISSQKISSSTLSTTWQRLLASNTEAQTNSYSKVYQQSLSLRENIAALSGLTRESDAIVFYFAEASSQRIPALLEYLKRLQAISELIITQGFDAESYTLVVALDKRIDELQVQLAKTISQLKRVANKELSTFLPKYNQLNKQLDDYQQALHQQMIDPDDISLNLSQATAFANNVYKQTESLLNSSDQLLLTRFTNLMT